MSAGENEVTIMSYCHKFSIARGADMCTDVFPLPGCSFPTICTLYPSGNPSGFGVDCEFPFARMGGRGFCTQHLHVIVNPTVLSGSWKAWMRIQRMLSLSASSAHSVDSAMVRFTPGTTNNILIAGVFHKIRRILSATAYLFKDGR